MKHRLLYNQRSRPLVVRRENAALRRGSICFTSGLFQGELEKLNQSTDDINRCEAELEVSHTLVCIVVLMPDKLVLKHLFHVVTCLTSITDL